MLIRLMKFCLTLLHIAHLDNLFCLLKKINTIFEFKQQKRPKVIFVCGGGEVRRWSSSRGGRIKDKNRIFLLKKCFIVNKLINALNFLQKSKFFVNTLQIFFQS
jgi:hypothetical protein